MLSFIFRMLIQALSVSTNALLAWHLAVAL